MFDYCDTCKIEIVAEDVVVLCDGLCEDQRVFHARCVGLSYDEGCAMHRTVFRMCDSCRDCIEKARFRKAFEEKQAKEYATKTEMDCLKLEVNRLSKLMSRIMTNHATVTSLPASAIHHQSDCCVAPKTSPLSSKQFSGSDQVVASDDTRLQLYVSNIAPDVTEIELKRMVCECIGADDLIHVKCLVPSWKNVNTLNYVPYKVTVKPQFQNAALKTSNWPSGVRCRIFRDYSDSAWRPSNRTI